MGSRTYLFWYYPCRRTTATVRERSRSSTLRSLQGRTRAKMGIVAKPFDGGALTLGWTRAPAKGPTATPPPSSGRHERTLYLWISPRLEKWGGERSKKERGGGRGHEPALLPLTLTCELPATSIAEPAAIADVRRHRCGGGSVCERKKSRKGEGHGLGPQAPPIAVAGAPPATDMPSPAAAARICREAGEERMESRVSRGRQTRFCSRDLRG
jgi:hypothetical protein